MHKRSVDAARCTITLSIFISISISISIESTSSSRAVPWHDYVEVRMPGGVTVDPSAAVDR
jgi:hypothetical protein